MEEREVGVKRISKSDLDAVAPKGKVAAGNGPARGREPSPPPEPELPLERACRELQGVRKRSLLILYYPQSDGVMAETDVNDCYTALRNGDLTPEGPLEKCDVLIHTVGGSPVAAYRLAQCIRDFAKDVAFLVPEQAYSAGTLLCFSGNEIRLGHSAGLSPIDITMVERGRSRLDEIQLASLDSYLQFCDDCQRHLQRVLGQEGVDGISPVGADLLVRLVDQVTALRVGHYYRARKLTAHYAEVLLDTYMLAGQPNYEGRRKKIVNALLHQKPVHDFHMDYHLCRQAGLAVRQMATKESDLAKQVVTVLQGMQHDGEICQPVTDYMRMPFVHYYPLKATA